MFTFLIQAYALTPQEAITAQAGCYKVTFQYEETEGIIEGYELHEPKKSEAIEWISVEYATETEISLQHVLVTGPMIRHWRQKWVYEPRELFHYTDVNEWQRKYYYPNDVSGKWGQIVYNVDDAPRYECVAEWHNDKEENYWSCTTWAPLPRRESKRSDYSILERENIHRIVKTGWIHEQNNTKFLYENNQRTDIAREHGYNTYEKIEDSNCQKAIDWWPSQRVAWEGITLAWEEHRIEHDTMSFMQKKGGIPLWIRLFWIAKRNKDASSSDESKERAYEKISDYLLEE